jgi:hypothetical protein
MIEVRNIYTLPLPCLCERIEAISSLRLPRRLRRLAMTLIAISSQTLRRIGGIWDCGKHNRTSFTPCLQDTS